MTKRRPTGLCRTLELFSQGKYKYKFI